MLQLTMVSGNRYSICMPEDEEAKFNSVLHALHGDPAYARHTIRLRIPDSPKLISVVVGNIARFVLNPKIKEQECRRF